MQVRVGKLPTYPSPMPRLTLRLKAKCWLAGEVGGQFFLETYFSTFLVYRFVSFPFLLLTQEKRL